MYFRELYPDLVRVYAISEDCVFDIFYDIEIQTPYCVLGEVSGPQFKVNGTYFYGGKEVADVTFFTTHDGLTKFTLVCNRVTLTSNTYSTHTDALFAADRFLNGIIGGVA